MDPRTTIEQFDKYLAECGLGLEAVVVGGAALNLLGVVERETRDCDVMDPDLPESIVAAARSFAEQQRARGHDLANDWFNDGPSRLKHQLPEGWELRLQPAYNGRALELKTLGRLDLLRAKVFAFCDRSVDLDDCIALAPTAAELEEIRPWVAYQDANPAWPEHVRTMLSELSAELRRQQLPELTGHALVVRVLQLRRIADRDPRELNEAQMRERGQARKELAKLERRLAEELPAHTARRGREPEE